MKVFRYFRSSYFRQVLRNCSKIHKRTLTAIPAIIGSGLLISSINYNINGKKEYTGILPTLTNTYTVRADDNNGDKKKFRKKFMYNFIADAVEKVIDSVVYIEVPNGNHGNGSAGYSSGSGVVVRKEGIVLTTAHVVNGLTVNECVKVRFPTGKLYEGYLIGKDERTDLAAIKLKTNSTAEFPCVKFSDSSEVRVGEWVAALGSPLRLTNTVTCGIVSTLHRHGSELKMRKDMEYIQTDASINIGNSGGPLINLDGEIIGINCATAQGANGISFAIPSDVVCEFLDQAMVNIIPMKNADSAGVNMNTTSEDKYYIGVSMLSLTPSILNQFRAKNPEIYNSVESGVWVGRVSPKSPAGVLGILSGDVIIAVNGVEVIRAADVFEVVAKGELMELKVKRKDQTIVFHVKPALLRKPKK